MQKILHIFPKEKFTGPFVRFINKNFSKKEHLFLVFGKNPNCEDLSIYDNILDFNELSKAKKIKLIYRLVKENDKIIFHSLFNYRIALLVVIFSKLTFKRKTKLLWRIWGGDLYNDFLSPNKDFRFRVKRKIRKYIKGRIIRNLYGITTPVKGDYELAKKIFKTRACFYQSIGNLNIYPQEFYNKIIENTPKSKNKTILLGNSASFTNNHFDAIDVLHKLRTKITFKVLSPLSYGDENYAKEVINYGHKRLGKDFIPILNFMKKENYIKLLATVDVAIMNHKRQQALGNISSLLRLGKKVYLRKETTSFSFYQNLGVKVFDFSNILNKATEEIFYFSEEDKKNNQNILDKFFTEENAIKMWERVFDE